MAFLLLGSSVAAQTIQVTHAGDDLVLTCPTVFQLRFDKSKGGTITSYYDLATDPGATTNLAAAGGSLYDGLYFVLFKQESPEMWTASFRSAAQSIELVDAQPQKVKVRVVGTFPDGGFGLPATYHIFYTITANAEIYIRSRIRFEQAYANEMQIRQALALTTTFATSGGWVEFSQDQNLTPYYYYGGDDDDYIGARIDEPAARVDPFLVIHDDWNIADYVLLIAPSAAAECLIAWVSNRHHTFAAGEVIENKFLLSMNQTNITSPSGPAAAAAAYRAGNGGDFSDQPGAPEAVATADPSGGVAPLVVSFDGTASHDPDGEIASYLWDFGDGSTGSGATASHTYYFPDTYVACLTVTDDDGQPTTAEVLVAVEGPRVVVDNSDGEPAFTAHGAWPTFDAQPGFHGPDYAVNDAGTGQDWARWQPDLSKGGPYRVYASWSTDADRPTDAGFVIHHQGGVQTVSVNMQVTDGSGWNVLGEFELVADGTEYVELTDGTSTGAEVIADAVMFEYLGENQGPVAQLTAEPIEGMAPLEVNFDAAGSTDADGTIVAYEWDFGDGAHDSGDAASHVFAEAGSYAVVLAVHDDVGAVGHANVTIRVHPQGGSGGFAGEVGSNRGLHGDCSYRSMTAPPGGWSLMVLLLVGLGFRRGRPTRPQHLRPATPPSPTSWAASRLSIARTRARCTGSNGVHRTRSPPTGRPIRRRRRAIHEAAGGKAGDAIDTAVIDGGTGAECTTPDVVTVGAPTKRIPGAPRIPVVWGSRVRPPPGAGAPRPTRAAPR